MMFNFGQRPGDSSHSAGAERLRGGILDLKVANLATDQELLFKARKCVEQIFEKDPQLALPENQVLHHAFETKNSGLSWDKIS